VRAQGRDPWNPRWLARGSDPQAPVSLPQAPNRRCRAA